MQKEYRIAVRWRAFPLHPETPAEGQLLSQLFRTSPEKIAGMLEHLRTTAQELGLPFGSRTRTYNSRLAQELGLWAADKGRGEAFHLAAFKAYFADGQNLALPTVLLEIAQSVGLAAEEAAAVLSTGSYRPRVDKDWRDSRERGITAVPTLVLGQDHLVGAQSYQEMVKLISRHGAVPRRRAEESP